MNGLTDPFAPAPSPPPLKLAALTLAQHKRFSTRFALVYGALGIVFALSAAVLVALVVRSAGPGWSSWHPAQGTTQQMAREIASHVSGEYRFASGSQLVGAVSAPPIVTLNTTNFLITGIAAHTTPAPTSNIVAAQTDAAETYTYCGFGDGCAITGTPSETRGQLVRREALETALYTFKYIPKLDTVLAFMPSSPSGISELLYLRRQDLTTELSEPLQQTLTRAKPPFPTQVNTTEGPLIDELTLPRLFTYTFTGLETNGALIILDPLE